MTTATVSISTKTTTIVYMIMATTTTISIIAAMAITTPMTTTTLLLNLVKEVAELATAMKVEIIGQATTLLKAIKTHGWCHQVDQKP